jgi:hypothetical protein
MNSGATAADIKVQVKLCWLSGTCQTASPTWFGAAEPADLPAPEAMYKTVLVPRHFHHLLLRLFPSQSTRARHSDGCTAWPTPLCHSFSPTPTNLKNASPLCSLREQLHPLDRLSLLTIRSRRTAGFLSPIRCGCANPQPLASNRLSKSARLRRGPTARRRPPRQDQSADDGESGFMKIDDCLSRSGHPSSFNACAHT